MVELANALKHFKQNFDPSGTLTEEEWSSYSKIWRLEEHRRKQLIVSEGETQKKIYFVLEGVQRVFYQDGLKEATLVFSYPYSFSGSMDSFLLQSPSKYYFETLSPTTFLVTDFDQFRSIRTIKSVETILQSGFNHAFAGLLERMVELQCYTAEEKFKTLLKRSPHILQLVPHKYLANYLGMDPTNFSKLINTKVV